MALMHFVGQSCGGWRSDGVSGQFATQPVAWMVTIVRNRAIDVRATHDVSRVDSYHDTLDDDPEARATLAGGQPDLDNVEYQTTNQP